MPFAAIAPIIASGIGAGGSIAGGKKARHAANTLAQQQLALQQQGLQMAQGQLGLGRGAFGPAENYWNALLRGGQAATQAVGPYASQIGQAAQGARTAIQNTTPMGGEQNLAMAQNYNQAANNIARLYAGMQPLAAQNLGQLAGQAFGSASGLMPFGNAAAALGNYGLQQQMANQGAAGFGGLLYNAINKLGNRGGGDLTSGISMGPGGVASFPSPGSWGISG
jgi:hypothetical protein